MIILYCSIGGGLGIDYLHQDGEPQLPTPADLAMVLPSIPDYEVCAYSWQKVWKGGIETADKYAMESIIANFSLDNCVYRYFNHFEIFQQINAIIPVLYLLYQLVTLLKRICSLLLKIKALINKNNSRGAFMCCGVVFGLFFVPWRSGRFFTFFSLTVTKISHS
jgi:hypothetical protein